MDIESKIIESVHNGDRDVVTLLWALTGIINVNSNFGNMPEIEDMIKDMQSTHNKYPQKPRECMRVFIESLNILAEKWHKKHTIWGDDDE